MALDEAQAEITRLREHCADLHSQLAMQQAVT